MVKDILKMTAKQRTEYLSIIDLNECNKQIVDFICDDLDLYERCEYSQLFNKSQKLLLGNNRSWECKKDRHLYLNIILIKLNVLMVMGYYDKFIKESEYL